MNACAHGKGFHADIHLSLAPYFRWFRLNAGQKTPTKIPAASDPQTEANTRVHVKNGRHLVIQNANEADNGPYEMVLSSIAGRVALHFQLVVTCTF